jgi:hypothetical protein
MGVTATKVPRVDYRRELGDLYDAREQPALIEVPTISYLMVDGHGNPNRSETFKRAVEALYAVAYEIKFRVRELPDGVDFAVMPLEGLWWIPNARVWDFDDKSDWDWTLMVAQPPVVTPELVAEAIVAVRRKKKELRALDEVRFMPFDEGTSAQVLHRGPFAAERPTLERLFDFVKREGYMPVGKHHEVYLSDPQRTAPGRMRTIIRQPVVPGR